MSIAGLYRARRRIAVAASEEKFPDRRSGMEFALSVLDDELERAAFEEYVRPINPDPVKAIVHRLTADDYYGSEQDPK